MTYVYTFLNLYYGHKQNQHLTDTVGMYVISNNVNCYCFYCNLCAHSS